MREIAGADAAVDRAPRNCGAEDEIYVTLDQREMATILAALRLYEDCAFGRVDERPQLIQEIASDGDAIAPLNNIEVGALCERINCDPSVSDSVRAAAPDKGGGLGRDPLGSRHHRQGGGPDVMADHTPGPWRVNSLGPARIIYDATPEGWAVADVKTFHGRHSGQQEANARLIAAAPELLAVLKEARDAGLIYWEPITARGYESKAGMLARIDAAIAKAEGRT